MKHIMIAATAALLTLAGCDDKEAAGPGTSATAAIAPPAGTTWSETVAKSSYDGYVMGNPNAAVKLVEYGALSCSHCAEFSEASKVGLKALVDKGTVSYELRNFLLNPLDVPAALLTRCGGAGPYFQLSEQLFEAQADWLGKASTLTAEDQARFQTMQPEQAAPFLAERLGLIEFFRQRGLSEEKARACLTDRAAIDSLANISKVGAEEFNIQGTPTFVINGSVVPNTGTWQDLEPKLKAAGA